MRIHALMSVRNEAQRYLQACLSWHAGQFDSFFLYDDQSGDQTREVAAQYRNVVCETRPDSVPSFMQHEGQFRQAAFNAFEASSQPIEGDWILALDADEFLVTEHFTMVEQPRNRDFYQLVQIMVMVAEQQGAASTTILIPEVWDMSPIRIRVDGYWGALSAPRLFRYMPPVRFANQQMGGGCWPQYVSSMHTVDSDVLRILHYGYAFEKDRWAKYERYTQKINNGHSGSHVASIIKPPTLAPWTGNTPDVWRGIK